jgi:integrase/recombinase XerD
MLRQMREDAEPGNKWVFPARTGDGHLVDLRQPLARSMKRAGIENLRPNDLRRSFASLAVNAGVDLYKVKDLLGHSSITVTQRSYAHLLVETLRIASEVVAKELEAAWVQAA